MLPKGWSTAKAAEVCELVQSGGTPKSGSSPIGEIPFLKVNNLVSQRIDFEARSQFIARSIHESELSKSRAYPGDVLMNIVGPPLGKIAVVPDNYQEWNFNQAIAAFRPSEAVSTEWIYWYLLGGDNIQSIMRETRGIAGQVNISLSQCRSFNFPVPPAAEQRRIVAKLDALTAHIARARAELDRVPVLAKRMRESALRAGVTGRLTASWREQVQTEPVVQLLERVNAPKQGRGGREPTNKVVPGVAGLSVNAPGVAVPNGWQWVSLLRVAKQETGHTPSRSHPEYWDGGIPWVGIRDAGAHHGRGIMETMQTISEEGLANSSARLLPKGTVCLSRTASVGYVTMMARDMATSQDFATWTCTDALSPEYLMYALMAEGDDIRKFGMGSTHTTIYFPEIRALHIALPPRQEQDEIAHRVRKALARADRLEAEAARARVLLDKLEASILAKAFRGELVPQDSNDEPASVLLERIRNQRAAAPKQKRGRRAAS